MAWVTILSTSGVRNMSFFVLSPEIYLPNAKLSYSMIIEREVCETIGSVAQFPTNRPERLQKHVPSLRPDEITGSQVYCRSPNFHYIL